MVLRLYDSSGCVSKNVNVERLILTAAKRLECKVFVNGSYVWRVFVLDKDFDSFVLAAE